MEKTLNSRDLKRIESDNKIIKATILTIGEKGYTASGIREIAKEAGITPGLVMQRFESKENLVIQAFNSINRICKGISVPENMTAYEVLIHIISDIKNMYENREDDFKFMYMMCGSTDIPEGVRKLQTEMLHESGLYRKLKKAQDAGNLPIGDLAVMYNIFISNALHLIRDYKRAGLKMPKDENFLSLIQYRDLIAEEQQLYRNKAFESVSQSFFNLIYFNISTGKFRIAKTIEEIEKFSEKFNDGQEFLYSVCNEIVDMKYRETIMNFVDLSTVMERIGDKKVIAEDYVGLDMCTYRISFISILREPSNEVVLCGVQKLKENK